jgi:transposase, IS30 family
MWRESSRGRAPSRRRLKPIGDFVHTITFDNGKEFAAHQDIAHALKAKIFFTTPYHAWERGLNENTNGLIRDFFPKGTDFSTISSAEEIVKKHIVERSAQHSGGVAAPGPLTSTPIVLRPKS